MMQVQMPKFGKQNSSDFIFIVYRPHRNCCLSLYLNISGVRRGPGKNAVWVLESSGNFCNQVSGNSAVNS